MGLSRTGNPYCYVGHAHVAVSLTLRKRATFDALIGRTSLLLGYRANPALAGSVRTGPGKRAGGLAG